MRMAALRVHIISTQAWPAWVQEKDCQRFWDCFNLTDLTNSKKIGRMVCEEQDAALKYPVTQCVEFL